MPMWAPLGSTLRSMEILCRDGEGVKENVLASICGHRAQLKGNMQNLSALSLSLCSNMNQHASVYSLNFHSTVPLITLPFSLSPLHCLNPPICHQKHAKGWEMTNWLRSLHFSACSLKCPYHVFTFLSFGEIQNRLRKFPLCVIYLSVSRETRVAHLVLPVTKLQ